MNNYSRRFFTVLLMVLVAAGCASTSEIKEAPVFFPEPPELPHVQYLTSFTSSMDIEPKRSSFARFITGTKEVVRRLAKPFGVATYDGKKNFCDSNSTVMVFDLNKKTFGPLEGAQGLGKLVQPINISIDKNGNKYVSDPVRKKAVELDKNHFYVKTYGDAGDWKPVDAVVYEDKLYVADI